MQIRLGISFLSGCAVAIGTVAYFNVAATAPFAEKVKVLEQQISSQKEELLGYTKYTDYLYAGQKTLQEQVKLVAATVVREESFTRVVSKKILGFASDSTVAVWYVAEYTFGYELKPDQYEISATPAGINIHLERPTLVAPPAVKALRHKVLSGGMLTDDKAAIINLYEGIDQRSLATANALIYEEAIIALCEKKLTSFLRDFLAKQPGVKQVPSITITYKNKKNRNV